YLERHGRGASDRRGILAAHNVTNPYTAAQSHQNSTASGTHTITARASAAAAGSRSGTAAARSLADHRLHLEHSVRQWQQQGIVQQDQGRQEVVSGTAMEVHQQQKSLPLQTKNHERGEMEAAAWLLDTLQNTERVEGDIKKKVCDGQRFRNYAVEEGVQ